MDTFFAQYGEVILILLVVGLVGYDLFRRSQAGETVLVTPPSLLEAVERYRPIAVELMEVAQVAVNATEQLKREGKIQSNDVAFNHAIDLVKKWIPDEWEVDNEDVIAAINSAVLVASALRKEAGASSENAKTQVKLQ